MSAVTDPVIVATDEDFVVADKPAGLPAVPGRTAALQDCAAARVQARWPDARVVHRLDMATSGLLLFARGAAMQREFSRRFAQREIDKHYVAVVSGVLAEDAGTIDLPLAADWPNRPRQQVDLRQGKPSLTQWRVLGRDTRQGCTRLLLQPHTGRTHQLRVHLQAIGHPILGDTLYAPPEVAAAAPRLLLHAQALRFAHPRQGTPVQVETAPPF